MNKTNKLILTGVVSAAVLGIIPFSQTALAQYGAQNFGNSDIASKIATKFNLNQTEVQAVFEEERTEMQAERQKTLEEKLTAEVASNEITEAQKQLIIEHQAANQVKMEEIHNITDDTARKTAMDALRTENQKWAADNSIDEQHLGFGEGRGERGMGGEMGEGKGEGRGGRGMHNSDLAD